MIYAPGLRLFILSSLIIIGLMIYSLRFRKTEIGRNFTLLIFCAFMWAIAFTLETAAIRLEDKLIFVKLEFIEITLLPAAWIFFIFSYSNIKQSNKSKFFF